MLSASRGVAHAIDGTTARSLQQKPELEYLLLVGALCEARGTQQAPACAWFPTIRFCGSSIGRSEQSFPASYHRAGRRQSRPSRLRVCAALGGAPSTGRGARESRGSRTVSRAVV